MNPVLAQKLKEAGFPQKEPIKDGDYVVTFLSEDAPYVPNLEELIEACIVNGDFHLEAMNNEWQASVCFNKQGEWEKWYQGSTPIEAVANLYIALNQKQ